jgi:hypothetical protein
VPQISLRELAGVGRGATGIVLTGLAVVTMTAATISWGVALAANGDLTGHTVDDRQLAAVLSAGHSCPMLSSSRLAGQLMAESGLNVAATETASGGTGLAGLDDEDWKTWAPWPNAARTDTNAVVLALAHKMCALSGELRMAGVSGDPWRLSLAAFRSGREAVVQAAGVPEEAKTYVDNSTGYSDYYQALPQFGAAGAAGAADKVATGPAAEAVPLPAEFVAPVAAAGKFCPEVTSAAVAGEVMAASAFNPSRLSIAGREGIAQFRTDVWEAYGPAGASAWDADVAIPAVGDVLCRLTKEFAGFEGDPYLLALAAFHSGPDTVRRAGGIPDAMTRAFLENSADYADYYRLDTRIGGAPAGSPPASSSPGASAPASAPASSRPSAGAPSGSAGAPAPKPAADLVKFSYPSFTSANGLKLNGSAKVADGRLNLTTGLNQAGSAYSSTTIDVTRSFSTSFAGIISQPTDGYAFLLQSSGPGAIGGTGGGMGYSGISPSIAVEFDTWRADNDPKSEQHIALLPDGNLSNHLAWADVTFDMRVGTPTNVWIDYDAGAKKLSVYASQSASKPGSPMFSHTIDLAAKFGGAKVYAGFGAGTGNTNLTDTRDWIGNWTFTGK